MKKWHLRFFAALWICGLIVACCVFCRQENSIYKSADNHIKHINTHCGNNRSSLALYPLNCTSALWDALYMVNSRVFGTWVVEDVVLEPRTSTSVGKKNLVGQELVITENHNIYLGAQRMLVAEFQFTNADCALYGSNYITAAVEDIIGNNICLLTLKYENSLSADFGVIVSEKGVYIEAGEAYTVKGIYNTAQQYIAK